MTTESNLPIYFPRVVSEETKKERARCARLTLTILQAHIQKLGDGPCTITARQKLIECCAELEDAIQKGAYL